MTLETWGRSRRLSLARHVARVPRSHHQRRERDLGARFCGWVNVCKGLNHSNGVHQQEVHFLFCTGAPTRRSFLGLHRGNSQALKCLGKGVRVLALRLLCSKAGSWAHGNLQVRTEWWETLPSETSCSIASCYLVAPSHPVP